MDLNFFIRTSSLPAGILLGLLIFSSVALQAQPTSTGALLISEDQYVYEGMHVQHSSSERLSTVSPATSSLVRSQTILSAQLEPSGLWTVWIKITSFLLILLMIVFVTIGSWMRAFKLP